FVLALVQSGGTPRGWGVTLPKGTRVDQVEAMVGVCAVLQDELGLTRGDPRFEIQGGTPPSLPRPAGPALVAPMVHPPRPGADRAALRHLRRLGVLRYRRRAAVPRAPGRRPREARHAGRRRRHGRAALRRVHERAPGGGRRRGRGGVGEPLPAGATLARPRL